MQSKLSIILLSLHQERELEKISTNVIERKASGQNIVMIDQVEKM